MRQHRYGGKKWEQPTRCSSRHGRRGPWRTIQEALFFNDTAKYVVSATLTTATWRNSKIIGSYDPDAMRSLKDEVGGDLYVSGSSMLVRAILADGLVDELHLFIYSLTRGSGPRLFREAAA
jgi:dihydrofolate reductase